MPASVGVAAVAAVDLRGQSSRDCRSWAALDTERGPPGAHSTHGQPIDCAPCRRLAISTSQSDIRAGIFGHRDDLIGRILTAHGRARSSAMTLPVAVCAALTTTIQRYREMPRRSAASGERRDRIAAQECVE